MDKLIARRTPVWLPLVLVTILAGCGDGPTEHDEEVHVHGVVISDAGTPVVTVEDGVITGSITVPASDETPDYDFVFTDHDGDPITSGLSDFSVDGVVDDAGIAIFHATAAFEAHLEGVTAGATTVVISLVHTADGDSHYDSPPIDVDVN
jgi:hypothetical protein